MIDRIFRFRSQNGTWWKFVVVVVVVLKFSSNFSFFSISIQDSIVPFSSTRLTYPSWYSCLNCKSYWSSIIVRIVQTEKQFWSVVLKVHRFTFLLFFVFREREREREIGQTIYETIHETASMNDVKSYERSTIYD